jgi:uncharacterized protein (DUF1330 family)
MSVYIIATIEILDPEQYKKYEEGFKASLSEFPGEIVLVEQKPQVLEGVWPHTRTVVMRFPSEEVAKGWYESAAYQELAKLRFKAANTNLILARGLR